jgi:hypothetical protein
VEKIALRPLDARARPLDQASEPIWLWTAESDLRIPVIANKSYDIRMDTAAVSTHITALDSPEACCDTWTLQADPREGAESISEFYIPTMDEMMALLVYANSRHALAA